MLSYAQAALSDPNALSQLTGEINTVYDTGRAFNVGMGEMPSSYRALRQRALDGGLIEGKVVAASDGMYSSTGTIIPLVVSEGDTILYNKNTLKAEHTIDGEEYILMSVNEVMSIVRDK